MSQIRNPVLARVFRELDLIEQWGSGIPGIFREAQALGLHEPNIEEIGMRVRFTVHLNEPVAPSSLQSRKSRTEAVPSKQSVAGAESGVESGVESELAFRIIGLLRHAPLSKAEIAREFGKEKPTRYLNDLMKNLLELGQVAYTIPEKPNSRLQKYRLTARGEKTLAGLPSPEEGQ